MDDKIITVTGGCRVLVAASADAKEAIEVHDARDRLRIVDRHRLIQAIEGDRWREKVSALMPPPRWNWSRREIVPAVGTVHLTTLPNVGRSWASLTLVDGRFVLRVGVDIVDRIETGDSARLLGLIDDRVL